jgi:lipopolysaccharide/colanic/teichoic acid biosynthesis glycosyltransferase
VTSPGRRAIPYDYLKRTLDLVGAGALLLVTLPVQVVVAVAVAGALGRPVLFRQQRPGLDSKVFTLVKFRTMKDVNIARGLVTDEQRLTRFGRILRSTSLDELPTLINVVKGDMSLVGPRPLLIRYLDRYTPEQARRHDVRPGVTGLAQVSGRNAISWESKFELDAQYVDRRSLLLDAKILFLTVSAVLKRDGITAQDQATTHEFMGTDSPGGTTP